MTTSVVVATIAVTLAAAVRSTWSPCGLSMLASITPLSEVGRGHRFRATASWYVAGSIVGGVTLGLCVAAVTVAVDALSPTSRAVRLVALAASAVAVVSDTRMFGFQLPVHHRQVNERWLDRFRPWVYGAGFGWQIGSGLATYIMTSAVYLMILLSALSGRPSARCRRRGTLRTRPWSVGLPGPAHHQHRGPDGVPSALLLVGSHGAPEHYCRRGAGYGALRPAALAVGRPRPGGGGPLPGGHGVDGPTTVDEPPGCREPGALTTARMATTWRPADAEVRYVRERASSRRWRRRH